MTVIPKASLERLEELLTIEDREGIRRYWPTLLAIAREHAEMVALSRDFLDRLEGVRLPIDACVMHRQLAALVGKETKSG